MSENDKLWEYRFVSRDKNLKTVLFFNLEGNTQEKIARFLLNKLVKNPDEWYLTSVIPLRRWEEYAEWLGKVRA